jgi:type II secretory pathway component PulM
MRRVFSVSACAEEMAGMAREAVRWHRRAGAKIGDALARSARDLGLTVRRVRALYYGEPVALRADEVSTARARWLARLDREAARLDAQAALLRARRAAISQDRAA